MAVTIVVTIEARPADDVPPWDLQACLVNVAFIVSSLTRAPLPASARQSSQ